MTTPSPPASASKGGVIVLIEAEDAKAWGGGSVGGKSEVEMGGRCSRDTAAKKKNQRKGRHFGYETQLVFGHTIRGTDL